MSWNRAYIASGVGDLAAPARSGVIGPVGYFRDYYVQKGFENAYRLKHTVPWGAGNLALNVGQGNYMTRNFRQKPIVGLQTATHTPNPNRVNKANKPIIDIPTVSQRRTKNYSKNKILRTSKAMPYTKKKVSRSAKRKYKKRIPLNFPRKKVVRFRAVANGTLSGAGGALATEFFKANSLNDPFGAAGAQLPLTLDQWAAFYEKYTVIGSKLTVQFSNTTNTGPVQVGIHLHKNNTALASHAHYKEAGMTKARMLTTQKDLTTITLKYSGKRFWHVGAIMSDSEQEASFSTTPGDPTDIAYYHVFLQDVIGSNNANCDYQATLEWICVLNEPINVARSSL